MSNNHSVNSSKREWEQGYFSAPLPAVFGVLITVFSSFVQVKYQSNDPFKTHDWIMLTFFVAILVFVVAWAFAVILQSQDSSHYKIFNKVWILSGALATISLVLILIPFLGWFLFVLWAVCFAGVAYDSYQDFKQLFNNTKLYVQDKLKKMTIVKRSMTEEGPNSSP